MSGSQVTPFDYDRYTWRPSPNDPSHYIREACGAEAFVSIWNRVMDGEQTLFVGITARFNNPIRSSTLRDRARDTWLLLRQSIPTVAAVAERDGTGKNFIGYSVPDSHTDAVRWAERTVILLDTKQNLDDIRTELSKKRLPDGNLDQTFIYIVPRSDNVYDFLLQTHHISFDGTGTSVLLTLFLRQLAKLVADPTLVSLNQVDWGSEVKKLLPVCVSVLGPHEIRKGPEFQETLKDVMTDIVTSTPRQRGFKERPDRGPGPTRRVSHKFTKDESRRLIQAARDLGFTINNWLHGALSLICIEDNPLLENDPTDAAVIYFGIANARGRLAAPYNSPDGYPGCCIGMSVFHFPFSLAQPLHHGETEKEKLVRAAAAINKAVQKQRNYPSLLAVHAMEGDLMLSTIPPNAPPPAPYLCPDYVADGIVEQYLEREYSDTEGNRVISIEDYFLSLNKTATGPFFRAWSFREQLVLSFDYNELALSEGDVQGFMGKWLEAAHLLIKGD